MRTDVTWSGKEKPGSIVVNVPQRRLYLVLIGGRALRYGVGVGRAEGMNFRGQAVVGRKEKWPRWTPTANMMVAIPLYRQYNTPAGWTAAPTIRSGRALYLYRDGHAVSSGCIRLFNQDIIDLSDRVPVGTRVTVVQG